MGSLGTWIVLAVQSSSPVLNQDLLILLLIVNRTDFRRLELTVVLLECPVTGGPSPWRTRNLRLEAWIQTRVAPYSPSSYLPYSPVVIIAYHTPPVVTYVLLLLKQTDTTASYQTVFG